MRTRADSPTIGVSCGHVVPRVPVRVKQGRHMVNRYWCETCNDTQMSGGRPTGINGHAYLFALRDLIEQNPRPIVVDDPGTDRGRTTVEALGARIRRVA